MVNQRYWRGVAIALVMLLVYQALIWLHIMPRNLGINQWENNTVRAEQYAYRPPPNPIVVVGSSLTHNVISSSNWREAIDLGMNSGAAQTGLEVLLKTPNSPGVVVVELNDTIARGRDAKLLDWLFQPQIYALRGVMSALRTEYRPIGIAVRVILAVQFRLSQRVSSPPAAAPVSNTTRRDQSVAAAYPILMQPLTAEQEGKIRSQAAIIRAQIDALEQAGWRVILCDIPRDSRLADTVQEQQLRAMMQELFPPADYTWLGTPQREWATNDGSHLVSRDAQAFAAIIRQAVEPLAAP